MENTKYGNHKLLQNRCFFPCVRQVQKINQYKQNTEIITRLGIKNLFVFYVLGGFYRSRVFALQQKYTYYWIVCTLPFFLHLH